MHKVIDVSALDAFFMSYGEPDANKHYNRNRLIIPRLQHISGIKGFDAVHRHCGELSNTDFLITIDADTVIHSSFLKVKLTIKKGEPDNLCFYSKNIVNNLAYGNGGIKIWAKDFAQNMAFHELGSGIDFCWDNRYRSIPKIYSETKINGSPIQAFRAGYREGIKLTSDHGKWQDPSKWQYMHAVVHKGLSVWCTIGADVEYGLYAIHGALLGVYDILTEIDDALVSDFQYHESRLDQVKKYHESEDELFNHLNWLREEIEHNSTLKLPKVFDVKQSEFIKSFNRNGFIF